MLRLNPTKLVVYGFRHTVWAILVQWAALKKNRNEANFFNSFVILWRTKRKFCRLTGEKKPLKVFPTGKSWLPFITMLCTALVRNVRICKKRIIPSLFKPNVIDRTKSLAPNLFSLTFNAIWNGITNQYVLRNSFSGCKKVNVKFNRLKFCLRFTKSLKYLSK